MPWKPLIKSLLRRSPRVIDVSSSQILSRLGLAPRAYAAYVKARRPLVVASGPFEGLRYIPEAAGSALYPKLVGSYELELQELIGELIKAPAGGLINVGSAEGYYAVGFLRARPELRAWCFDPDRRAHELLRQLAALNGVEERAECFEDCSPEAFDRCVQAQPEALILMDCEGAEQAFLDPERCPALKHRRILVELHDCFIPGLTEEIEERFQSSHEMCRYQASPRAVSVFMASWGERLTDEEKLALMDEGRDPEQRWLYMIPKERRS